MRRHCIAAIANGKPRDLWLALRQIESHVEDVEDEQPTVGSAVLDALSQWHQEKLPGIDPFLKNLAAFHTNPRVRARARALLSKR